MKPSSKKKDLVELSEANTKKWPSLIEHIAKARTGLPGLKSETGDKYKCTRKVRQRQKRLDADEVSRLIEAYRSGLTVYQLAERFGCHRTTVGEQLKAHGIRMRRIPLPAEHIPEAVRLYGSGLSCGKISKQFGVSPETVRKRLIENGVRMRDSHGRKRA